MVGVWKRSMLALMAILLCCTVAVFTFRENAQAALDAGIQKAHDRLESHLNEHKTGSSDTANNDAASTATPEIAAPVIGHENATFFTLCQNKDLRQMLNAVKSVEKNFNHKFKYDWVFLNDVEFSNDFKSRMKEVISGDVHFGVLNSTMWGYPDWIDLDRAAETRQWMKDHNVVYGDLESYHHMCRFQAGWYFRHPLLEKYKYSWRVEPSIKILCKQKQDPFRLMRLNDYTYGFNVAPQDIRESITTLWSTTQDYLHEHKDAVHKDSLKDFLSDDGGDTYNTCHFWTNFEIVDMDWLRSDSYLDYFNYLDQAGGFYYERWGDAPIRSIAASLFLPKEKIYFFNDVGYYHAPYGHCPYNQGPLELECECHPGDEEFSNKFYDFHKNSCMRRYFKAKGRSYHDPNPDEAEAE